MDYSHYSQKELNEKLVSASFHNDLPLIKYLLTSPKLKQHAQINADSRFIANICSHQDLNTLKYVLTSSELKEHANLNIDSERALCCAIYSVNIPMIKYLLNSPELKKHSNLYADHYGDKLVIENIFRVRAFADSAKLIDFFTLDYAVENKDSKIFTELMEYADNDDLKKQIIENLFNNIVKEDHQIHQHELKVLLKKLDSNKFNMLKAYTLSKELESELRTTETKDIKKMKV